MGTIKKDELPEDQELSTKETSSEPVEISGTGSNPEESDFIAVPDKD